MWTVYILESKHNTLYTGITNNIDRRVQEHKQGKGAAFTRAFGAKTLVYQEKLNSRSEALCREAQIKKLTRDKKLVLIKEFSRHE